MHPRSFSAIALASMFATACRAQVFPNAAPVQSSPDRKNVRIDQRLGEQVPLGTELRDRNGRTVHFGDVLGNRPAIVLPIFYRCSGVCNIELQTILADLPKMKTDEVGRDFDIVVLRIDPQEGPGLAKAKFQSTIDSSPELKGTEGGWHFLTGSLDSIRAVTDALGFHYTYDAAKDLINHPSGIMFLTSTGTISSYILGPGYTPATLTNNLHLASNGKVGEKSADVFSGCIHINPLTGQRSIAIERVVRLLGALTVLGLVGTIAGLSLKSRLSRNAS